MSFQMCIPTRILFGTGKLNELHQQKMPERRWGLFYVAPIELDHENCEIIFEKAYQ